MTHCCSVSHRHNRNLEQPRLQSGELRVPWFLSTRSPARERFSGTSDIHSLLFFAEKLVFSRQRVRLVHFDGHHVAPIIPSGLPKLEDSAAAGSSQLARELCSRHVVRHMHFWNSGRVSKCGDGNPGGKAQGGAEEFLDIVEREMADFIQLSDGQHYATVTIDQEH